MLLGFIYQIANGNGYMFREINFKLSGPAYMNQVKAVMKSESKIVCKWKYKIKAPA